MKTFTSAIALLVASTVATAAEPQAGTKSLVVAYNEASRVEMSTASEPVYVSEAKTDRVLARTLDVVSASLSVELDNSNQFKIAEETR